MSGGFAQSRGASFAMPCSGTQTCPISLRPCPGHCLFADVLASISLGVIVFDFAAEEVLFANRWARRLLERAGMTLEYGPLAEVLLPSGRGMPGGVDQPPPLRRGSRFLGFTVYYATDFAWVFLRDITQKARLESVAEAVETTNNLGYVFSAVRHELGNPVNSVKIALSVLDQNLERFSREEIADYVRRISSEVGRIERLLRSLRSFSAYERPEASRVDLTSFFDEFSRLVRHELEARGIGLEIEIEPGSAATCDPRAMHQVLLNLVTNASDALAGCASPRITLRASCSDAVAILRVQDNGVGISALQQRSLFKPFSTTKPRGTGLGLVIARKLLAAMDGTIGITSAPGEGTTVTLVLPGGDPPGSSNARPPMGSTP